MKNIDYMMNLLLDIRDYIEQEGEIEKFERLSPDDGGASEEAMIFYNINCPYYANDNRCECKTNHEDETAREICVRCKSKWLFAEVDE